MNAAKAAAVALLAGAVTAAVGTAWLFGRVCRAERRAVRGDPRGDAVVVFGASVHEWGPSGELRARLDHAAELWRMGAAPVVIVSGGIDRGIDEVDMMAAHLGECGVPPAAVRAGRPGTNTRATISTVARMGEGRYVAVSSPYHAWRIENEARRQGVPVVVSAPERTPEMCRPRARATRRLVEVAANLWYAAPRALTSRLTVPRLRHTLPELLSGYRPPPRSEAP